MNRQHQIDALSSLLWTRRAL